MEWSLCQAAGPNAPDAGAEAAAQARVDALKNEIPTVPPGRFRQARAWVHRAEHLHTALPRRLCSRAGTKLLEILLRFRLLQELPDAHTVHLCEAPGAFQEATALVWDTVLQRDPARWVWQGVTLPDGLKWQANAAHVVYADLCTDSLPDVCARAHLVTGDGGFDVKDPAEQERASHALVEAQITKGVPLLLEGGSLVVKLFDMWRPTTRELLLREVLPWFETTYLYKPWGSRLLNGERYVVGMERRARPVPVADPAAVQARLAEVAVEAAAAQAAALAQTLKVARAQVALPRRGAHHDAANAEILGWMGLSR